MSDQGAEHVASRRRAYELEEQVVELEDRLAAQVERERITGLELSHLRRQLDAGRARIQALEAEVEKVRAAADEAVAEQVRRRTELRRQRDRARAQRDAARQQATATPTSLKDAFKARLRRHPRLLEAAWSMRRSVRGAVRR